jgi:DNA repair exonuclease SbcCD ATPase subunit
MIRRLTLKNWRSYADIDLSLGPGTTFIVAPNGIGKTSLMEAAAWAVFGDSGQVPDNAIRIGAGSAVATAEIELPDERVLTITRTLPHRPKAARTQATALLQGEEIDPGRVLEELRRSYAADPAFLVRLTMPHELLDSSGPTGLRLEEHLCRLFGVEGLQRAIENLDQRIKAQERQIKAAKLGSPADPRTLSALQHQVKTVEDAAREFTAWHASVATRLDRAKQAKLHREQLRTWQEKENSRFRALHELTLSAASEVELNLQQPETIETALDTALASVQSDLEAVRVRQALLSGRASALAQHSEELGGTHDSCPVCRRPLDAETIRFAKSAHEGEQEKIQTESEQLRQRESVHTARQTRIRELIQTFRSIPSPGSKPVTEIGEAPHEQESVSELEAEARSAFDRLIESRAALDRAKAEFESAVANEEAHNHLRKLYEEEAILRASRVAISAATRQLLDQTIQPLAAEVNARWNEVFPRRGRLRTLSNGNVSREFDGGSLPYSAFSTGERTGLVVLLRLLVLETSTKANFCWFDEPLEHLDPDSRRRVGSILTRASNSGPLKQIVISTYEEPLARRLQERDPEHVSLIYVRQAPA